MTSSFVWGRSTGRLGSSRPSTSASRRAGGQPDLDRRAVRPEPERLRQHRRPADRRPARSPSRPSSSTSSRPGSWSAPTSPTRTAGRSAAWCASATSSASRPTIFAEPHRRQPHGVEPEHPRPAPAEGVQAGRQRERGASSPTSSTRSTTTPTRTCRTGWAPRRTSALRHRIRLPRRRDGRGEAAVLGAASHPAAATPAVADGASTARRRCSVTAARTPPRRVKVSSSGPAAPTGTSTCLASQHHRAPPHRVGRRRDGRALRDARGRGRSCGRRPWPARRPCARASAKAACSARVSALVRGRTR